MLHDEDKVRAVLHVRDRDSSSEIDHHNSDGLTSRLVDASARLVFPTPGKIEGLSNLKKPVIEIKDTWFKYSMRDEYALRSVNVKITLASRVAIVGPNGAGKSTLLALLCGEIRPTPNDRGAVGEVVRHRSLRLAYVAQDQLFHLKDYTNCSAVGYIQVRFRHGYDEELQKRLNSPTNEKEDEALGKLAARYGKYGKRVEALASRQKRKSEWRYEVKWEDLTESQNTFETLAKLRQMGVEQMATALDERLAAAAAGTDERPLTNREVVKHFENFGLSEDLVLHRPLSGLSGGQKSKLVLAAACWMKPHVLCFDEPTNFLDFDTVDSLARCLRHFHGGVVIVSHSEDFLASFCEEIWSVQDHAVTVVRPDIPLNENVSDGGQPSTAGEGDVFLGGSEEDPMYRNGQQCFRDDFYTTALTEW